MLRNRSFRAPNASPSLRAAILTLALGPGLGLLPQAGHAQDSPIVASEIRVTPREATLTVEGYDGTAVSLTLRDGRVLQDGTSLGAFSPGGDLDRAWRALLSQALNTEPAALSGLLGGWSPPRDLPEADAESAAALAEALRGRLEPVASAAPSGEPQPLAGQEALVAYLLENPESTARIQRLIQRSPSELQWWVGGDHVVPDGTRLEGNLAVLGGNLELNGTLGGDLVMFQGDVRLGPRARIEGDLRMDGGLIRGSTQGVEGRVQRMTAAMAMPEESATARDTRDTATSIRSDIVRGFEAGWDAGGDRSARASSQSRMRGPLGTFFTGFGNLLRAGMSFVVLLGMGLGALYFFPRPFEVVTRTSQDSFWRSLLVGWAALVLSPFVWITGMVLLVVTLIGIPFALIWIPAFWLALAVALLFGTLAVSRMMGAWWVSRSGLPIPRGLDPDKPAVQLGIGSLLLVAGPVAAAVFQMAGSVFEIFRILSAILGGLLVVNVMALGLGAMLLSRAGRDGRWTNGLEDLALDLDDELFTSEAPRMRE
jgi:hypothetical protein